MLRIWRDLLFWLAVIPIIAGIVTIIVNIEKVFDTIVMRPIRGIKRMLGRYNRRQKELLDEIVKVKEELNREKQRLEEVLSMSLENLERKEQQLKEIYVITLEIGSMYRNADDREHLYRFLFELLANHLMNDESGTPRVHILVEDDDNDQLLRPYRDIWVGHSPRAKHLRIEKTYDTAAGYAYLTGECYFDPDTTRQESRFKPNPHATRKTEAIICVPIRCSGDVLGVLSVSGENKYCYTEDNKEFLEICAGLMMPLLHEDLKWGSGGRKNVHTH